MVSDFRAYLLVSPVTVSQPSRTFSAYAAYLHTQKAGVKTFFYIAGSEESCVSDTQQKYLQG
jgi:hypothetical protein